MVEELRDSIEQALRLPTPREAVTRIKQELSEAIRRGEIELGPRFHVTRPDRYARRLLFRDPELGVTAVVMTWGPGQGTPVHDHSGMWCVEGVVEGEMSVTQYELQLEANGVYYFHPRDVIHAGVGAAGSLIPPYEHHVLANAAARPSLTLHIYGGEMKQCHIYLPRPDGAYERQTRLLAYDE